ncbi:glycosyltransferase family 4 protein [Clostridium sp. D2Q-11]|uniref:Glycosyltransferase family 4 protein n=1 Tax=Anaeromonas frigoriresistens TaxID=2683708 RepID=A0A942UVJ3_9FIRM|nr:glycosyltransferase family 4 protein [Anaeromonas frigoriresistens]MBS4538830.1 glycosyltransferase family 4 protein [Anaeromonas frigoriresistens]
MKICILTTGHEPTDGRIFTKEVKTLLNNGFKDITIICPYHKELDEIDGVKIIGFKKRKSNSFKDRFKPVKDLYRKALKCKADIYHCHEPDALVIGYLLKRKYGAKLIYDSHEYHPEHFAERYKGVISKVLFHTIYRLEKYFARKTDYVITVNEELVEKFKSWGCKTALLPNYAVNNEDIIHKEDSYISALKDKGYIVGIFAGGIYKERGIIELIEANSIVKNKGYKIAMIFIGWYSDRFVDYCKDIIRKKDLSKEVAFLGKKEHSEVINMMMQSDFGMVNDYLDKRNLHSCAIKLFEYMQCGIPIYSSNNPAHRTILESENCGVYANPMNPQEIGEVLIKLCKDRDLMKEMGSNGFEAFKKKYNWSVVEGRLLHVYRELGDI